MSPAVQGSPTAPPPLPEPIVEQPLSKTLLDKFDKVLDMFKGALDNLSKPAKQQPPPSPSVDTGATGGSTPTSSAGAGGGAVLPRIKISILLQHLQVWKVVVIKREQTLPKLFTTEWVREE